jgi:flagellar assembly factor FliW
MRRRTLVATQVHPAKRAGTPVPSPAPDIQSAPANEPTRPYGPLAHAHETTIVHSGILGDIRIRPSDMLQFPGGLLGFPQCQSFVLLEGEREGLYWLQSIDSATLVFLLVDPFVVIDGCAIDVPQAQLDELGGGDPSEVAVLSIVTLPRQSSGQATANLQAPIVINVRTRTAKQIVCSEGDYGVRCPVDIHRAVA